MSDCHFTKVALLHEVATNTSVVLRISSQVNRKCITEPALYMSFSAAYIDSSVHSPARAPPESIQGTAQCLD